MPRNGEGQVSQNGPIEGDNLIHGQGPSDKIPEHTNKVADLPEGKDEKGLALDGMNASGGQSAGIKQHEGKNQVGQGN